MSLQKTAARLIDKKGAPITITTRLEAPARDAAKPWRGSTGTEDVVVQAVQYPYEVEEMPDATARRSNTRFIIAEDNLDGSSQFNSVDLTTATDVEDADGDVWSISLVTIIEPGADRLMYMVEATR